MSKTIRILVPVLYIVTVHYNNFKTSGYYLTSRSKQTNKKSKFQQFILLLLILLLCLLKKLSFLSLKGQQRSWLAHFFS